MTHLPLYTKTFEFIKHLYRIVKQFPKEYKFTIGEEIIKMIWQISDDIALANLLATDDRRKKLAQISLHFDLLKIRLRMAHEIGLINREKFSSVQIEAAEIGKMIGGWQKWAEGE